MTHLNPRHWKPEHRLIFALLVAAGALAGTSAGYFTETTFDATARPDLVAWIGAEPSIALLWALLGAIPIGAIAYAIRITAGDG